MTRKPSIIRQILGEFTTVEFVFCAALAFFGVIALIFYDVVNVGAVAIDISWMLAVIILINWANARFDNKLVHATHTFYVVPIVVMLFKTVEKLSFVIHGHDFDDVLISVDRTLFGTDPTVWLYHHIPVMPWFVEFLQSCYFMYYLLPVIVAAEIFRRKQRLRNEASTYDLEYLRFSIIFALIASYLIYLIMPAVGPRFTLHDFANLPKELPGIWFTDKIRAFINWGENISATMTNAQAMKVVSRDVFPSGHTEITLVTILLAFRLNVRSKWFVLFVGSGLIFSTVYLRYHYVIDVFSGAIVALVVLYSAAPLMAWFAKMKMRIQGSRLRS